jgi:alpha-L-fucosidase
MHNTEWIRTELVPETKATDFKIDLKGLVAGKEYQFRSIVRHPKITIRGDHKRATAR